MIDLCPRCRIQAPHKPGRERCPRCGGPLSVVDEAPTNPAGTRPAPAPAPPPHTGMPASRPPIGAPPVGATPTPPPPPPTPPRPTSGPRTGRLYRSPHVRWVARRPPESVPSRRPRPPVGPRLIPRYPYIPDWGLRDTVRPVDTHAKAEDPSALRPVLRLTGIALTAMAVVHALRYLLLVVNRSTPVPRWLDLLTVLGVWVTGFAAFVAFVVAVVVFVSWVRALRTDTYHRRGQVDPRRRWMVAALTGLPLVNVIGAGWMIREAMLLRPDLSGSVPLRRATKIWVAWLIVNLVALAALVVRVVAWLSESVQTAANGLWLVVISAAISAAFAFWLPGRLERIFGETHDEAAPTRRWVQVA